MEIGFLEAENFLLLPLTLLPLHLLLLFLAVLHLPHHHHNLLVLRLFILLLLILLPLSLLLLLVLLLFLLPLLHRVTSRNSVWNEDSVSVLHTLASPGCHSLCLSISAIC